LLIVFAFIFSWTIVPGFVTIILRVCHYQNDTYMKNLANQPCLIARSLALVGDAWSMLIMRDAHAGLTRFDEFRKSLDVAPTILTRRLAALTEEGLLEKRRYSERPPRDEYVLTAAGRDFLPVLFAIGAWGRKYRGRGKPVTRFFDAETGTEIDAVTIDRATGAPIGTRSIRIAAPSEQAKPVRRN
jgi:DNA-binding HxlR family transcriptional regulator